MDDNADYSDPSAVQRAVVLSISIKERAALYAAYMPYLKGGGIFLPTAKSFAMGDAVLVILQLLDNPKRFPLNGIVAWITPAGVANKAQGIGVQFPQDELGLEARQLIESSLGSALRSGRKTHTL